MIFQLQKLKSRLSRGLYRLYYEEVAAAGIASLSPENRCLEYFDRLNILHDQWGIHEHTKETELLVILEEIRHMRIFGHCLARNPSFLGSKFSSEPAKKSVYLLDNIKHFWALLRAPPSPCEIVHKRIFPYLTGNLPIYHRWTGEVFPDIPIVSEYNSSQENGNYLAVDVNKLLDDSVPQQHLCLVQELHSKVSGKGIVITTNVKYAPSTVALIRVLRALGNTYPIEIVHTGLSKRRFSEILKAARALKSELGLPTSQELENSDFPPQELWFIDVSRSISSNTRQLHLGYGMKLMALLFSTFEEVVLMDSDAVPMVPMDVFFGMLQYRETGTVFFQDRSDLRFNPDEYLDFFAALMPNDTDTRLFGIPGATQHTFGNRYMKQKFYYFMEAGVVVINKKQHISGVLMAATLGYWKDAIHEMLWGDKELYWLGLLLAGDENYKFNLLHAAAVGEILELKLHFFPKLGATEVCSTHPGQISDNDGHTLLWINSGFEVCKSTKTLSWDSAQPRYKGLTRIQLRQRYKLPLKIEAALIPPLVTKDYEVPNSPPRGWKQTQFCHSYLWCAYDVVADRTDDADRGIVVQYSEEEMLFYDFLGEIWVSMRK